ncbi:hypothetical protein AT727_02605 [Desulfitobacterium hafniense]|uniref:Bacterial sugar transferase domain-containing protein n=1 Tax=Desulfitobacterium hafniense TaxID=49338 RepID=A0A0W1JRQ5_DESHA|nr:sugar transferase [Desulfitobacterium hafniense]KTE93864.1 hypothetical protein AT727_02605 [Desulfitobacterium hafniense]
MSSLNTNTNIKSEIDIRKKANYKTEGSDNIRTKKQKKYVLIDGHVYDFLKRSFDIIFAIMFLMIASPVMLVVAFLIKLEDGGPIVHARICIGKNNREYKMYKFRSMIPNADQMFQLFTPEQMERYKVGAKFDDDPRLTRVGKFIRRISIDELPQLFSVVRNDMSVIGPRPVIEREAAAYGENRNKLLSVKPGITGWWQVNGRSDCAYLSDEAKNLQLYYVDHRSMGLDIKILLKTFKVVFYGKGAR